MIRKKNKILNIGNTYLVDSPLPSNLTYNWNYGSLLGVTLVIQIITGVTLAMHYTPTIEGAFKSIEHICRDVNYGVIIKYTHANVASYFFILMYLHISRGIYYGSYKSPTQIVWNIGVVIFLLTMAIGFLGYTLPWGQMSYWGIVLFIKKRIKRIKRLKSTKRTINKPTKEFMAMLIGFIDGDGYIEIGPQKGYNKNPENKPKATIRIRLVIRLHERDKILLEYIKKELGIGSLTYLKKNNQYRLIFYKRDITEVLMPLMKEYKLEFLVKIRIRQYGVLNYIIDNNIKHIDDLRIRLGSIQGIELKKEKKGELKLIQDTEKLRERTMEWKELVNKEYFKDWVVGFTMAEGWFGKKNTGAICFQIRQTGIENLYILKAICFIITGREAYEIKPDKDNSYQLAITSKKEILKVKEFFTSPEIQPLIGYKREQFENFYKLYKN